MEEVVYNTLEDHLATFDKNVNTVVETVLVTVKKMILWEFLPNKGLIFFFKFSK